LVKNPFRKGDVLHVISGSSSGKFGEYQSFDPKTGRVVIKGVNMGDRHVKPRPDKNVEGGIVKVERSIHHSNIMVRCPSCAKPVRPKAGFTETMAEGKTVRKKRRVCRACLKDMDALKK
jgi:large subunit ribosomal protein L24